jgi:hypothetical protein
MRDGSVFDTLETMGLMNGAHAEDIAQAPVAEPEVLAMAPQVDYVPFADLPVLDRLRTAD